MPFRTALHIAARAIATLVALLAATSMGTAHAEPAPPDPADPWPMTRFYDHLDAAQFIIPGADGVWFTAPTGQNCGIWGRGSFACSGHIPGAPPGTEAVGWVTGDRAMHYDWTVPFRMPKTRAHAALPPRTVVEHQGSSCAVTDDARTYCERGPLKFLITEHGTWLTPPWMDLSNRR